MADIQDLKDGLAIAAAGTYPASGGYDIIGGGSLRVKVTGMTLASTITPEIDYHDDAFAGALQEDGSTIWVITANGEINFTNFSPACRIRFVVSNYQDAFKIIAV